MVRASAASMALFSLGMAVPLSSAQAPEEALAPPDLTSLLDRHAAALAGVDSNEAALQVFIQKLGVEPSLQPTALTLLNAYRKKATPPEMESTKAVRFTADLAAWGLARRLHQAAEHTAATPEALQAWLEESRAQRAWLLLQDERSKLERAVTLAVTLAAPELPRPAAGAEGEEHRAYAARQDQRSLDPTRPDASWLDLADRDGAPGLRRRLMSEWPEQDNGHSTAASSREVRESVAGWYFAGRIRPMLTAHLIARALQAQAEAQYSVLVTWQRLQQRGAERRKIEAFRRLCGTWQWTVHNHQHHQDHKMLLTITLPEDVDPSSPRPTKIVVLGDVVYLRWEFPQGYQEDSLLLSSEGRRVEGTFVNSAGAWGSISGKLLKPCTKTKSKN